MVFFILCLLEVGFKISTKISTASAAEVGSGLRLPDLNGDGFIDMRDVAICGRAFYSNSGDPNWNSAADLNYDGVVDMRDVAIMVKVFGKNCQGYDFSELSGWNVNSGNWSIQNGNLEGFSDHEGLIFAGNSTWEDFTLSARVKIAGDGKTPEVALAFRLSDSKNFYYAGLGCWGHKLSISRHVGSSWKELAFSGDQANVDRDVWHILTAKVSGGTIMLYLDGSLELSVNDSTFARGSVGVRIWNSHVIIDYVTVIGTRLTQGQPAYDVLYADGTVLRTPSGEEVVLVGTQYDYNALDRDIWFGIDDVEKMKAYGGSVLELHILWFRDMMPERGVIDQNWINRLDKWVSWCEQEQMYYIISFQNFEYKNWGRETPDWFLKDKYPTPWDKNVVNKASLDFWDIDNPLQDDNRQNLVDAFRFLADRYKNNRYVLFGLINEPFAGNDLVNSQNAEHLSITYARFIERIIDAIRSTGAKQLIFVDKPYVWYSTDHFEPVNRDGIVWEDHLYVTTADGIDQWKAKMNEYVQRYVYGFHKPFYVGEYGVIPFDQYQNQLSNWRTILAEQVTFLKSIPTCGYSWQEYPWLWGEYYDYVYNYLTKDDSDYILETIYR